ncbi:hypothetical protein D9M73_203810 [compost metagenome]
MVVVRPNSGHVVLPNGTAPACSYRLIRVLVRVAGGESLNIRLPLLVTVPCSEVLRSLISSGTPARAPWFKVPAARRWASMARA